MVPHSKYSGTLSAHQFDEAAKQANLSPMMLARARRVLVDGESVLDVAVSDGVGVTAIYRAVHKVYSPPDVMAGDWPSASPMAREPSNQHTNR